MYYLIALLVTPPAGAALYLSATEVPETPDGNFGVTLVGVEVTDPRNNPCYRRKGCRLKFFTIDESWLPVGRHGYSTIDWGWSDPDDDAVFRTIGEWVRYQQGSGKLYRTGYDYLPSMEIKLGPCVVIAAGAPTMIAGTIVSNCAKGIVQAPTCELLPSMINLHTELTNWGRNNHGALPDTPIQLTCQQDSDVQIETNTDERIPLGGMSDFYAELDWGAGYGKPGSYKVTANEPSTVRLRASIKGAEKIEPGTYSGTAVVNVSYL